MFRAAGVNFTGPVTYFTDELAVWLDGPNAENNFSYKFTDGDRSKGGKAPVKKSKIPELQAGIDAAGSRWCAAEGRTRRSNVDRLECAGEE
jgi:hypothetical protein